MSTGRLVMELGGLHHVTAVTTEASENVTFYTEVLGLRLVKKTVNQDDVSAYHLFYGDELGRPGTEITFFDWPQFRIAPNHAGAGEVSTTELRVRGREALDWWAGYLEEHSVRHEGVVEYDGRSSIAFTDPEGQRLRLAGEGEGPAVAGGSFLGREPRAARVRDTRSRGSGPDGAGASSDRVGARGGFGLPARGGVRGRWGPGLALRGWAGRAGEIGR